MQFPSKTRETPHSKLARNITVLKVLEYFRENASGPMLVSPRDTVRA
jgi:hypothetical protein